MEAPFLVERLARFSVWVRKDRSVRSFGEGAGRQEFIDWEM